MKPVSCGSDLYLHYMYVDCCEVSLGMRQASCVVSVIRSYGGAIYVPWCVYVCHLCPLVYVHSCLGYDLL